MLAGTAAAIIALAVAAPPPPPIPTDSLFAVAWRKTLVEPYLLEYKPFEPAGPGIDPLTGMVVVATRDGYVQAYSAEGKDLWYARLVGPYLAPPTVGDGLAIIAGLDGRVFAFDAARGEFRWMYRYREEFGSQPVVAGDLVYFATLEGTVLALDARTGAWMWHFRREPSGKFVILGVGRPSVVDGVLYQGFADGTVVALDARTGAVKWDKKVGRGAFPDVIASVQVVEGPRLRRQLRRTGGGPRPEERAPIWESRAPEAYKARLDGDLLVVVTTRDVLGFDARTGKELWTIAHEGGAPRRSGSSRRGS